MEDNCPNCRCAKLFNSSGSVAALYPELVLLLSNKDNTNLYTESQLSKKICLWKCPTCKGESYHEIQMMTYQKNWCPYCNGDKPMPGYNTVMALYPDVASLLSPADSTDLNNELPTSTKYCLWKCPNCGGTNDFRVCDMVSGEAECPYCSGAKVLPGFNSVAVKYPELLERLSVNDFTNLDEYLPTAKKTCLWRCPKCGGEAEFRICDMVIGKAECPYCNGTKVLPGFNSFAAKHSDLLPEWDYVANYLLDNPDTISERSTRKYWWYCSIDPTHKYCMSPKDRLMFQKRQRNPCLYCKGRRRKKGHFC